MWEKIDKRKINAVVVILLLCSLMVFGVTVSYAGDRTGDIDLDYEGRTDYDDDVILEGAKFIIYPVKYVEDGKLVWREEFAKCGIAMDDSSSQARSEQAKKLYAYAKKHDIPGVIYITDKKGCIEINDLAEGIYLIAQTEEVEEGRDGFMSDPFLVMVPTEENGETEWDVDVEPKADWVSHDGEPVYPGDKPKADPKDDSKDNPKEPTTNNTTNNSKKESVNSVKKMENNSVENTKKKDIRERIFGFGRTKTGDLSIVDIWFTILMVSVGMITIIVTVRKRK